ncbi:SDR family NAD(P)-dependent oxidoreductase [Microbacterium sp. NPDC058342]|uniref:SDR family NAD(P)-dependent oxidoreductase n=1 Tax=Microbacterium sp. NPDC058342 TaxID=3346454 RepID=UPI003668FFE1
MLIDLSGKVAIVTGAGRGIGREIARTLAREGAIVASVDLNEHELTSLGTELDAQAGEHREYVCDVRDAATVNAVVDSVVATFGRIDILVNNAGIAGDAPIESLAEHTWDAIHDINLKGTFLFSKAVIPAMKAQRSGRIINAASFAAIVPIYGSSAYASSKAAVAQLTRGLAGELGPWNITVNAYAPGMVPTSINGFTERPEEEQARLLSTLTLRRWGSTDDVSDLVCFLASERASYITGTLIDVSGGKLATQVPGLAYEAAAAAEQ